MVLLVVVMMVVVGSSIKDVVVGGHTRGSLDPSAPTRNLPWLLLEVVTTSLSWRRKGVWDVSQSGSPETNPKH